VIPMYQYANALVNRGHRVTVFTGNTFKLKPAKYPSEEIIKGIAVRRFKICPLPLYDQFFLSFGFLISLASFQTDVIHLFSWIPSFFIFSTFMIAKLRGIPLIMYPQCYPERSAYSPSLVKRLFGSFMDKALGPIFFKRADAVIALTQKEAIFYKRAGVKKIEIVREPVLENKPLGCNSLGNFKRKFGIYREDLVILSVARIVRYKGIHVLIYAVAHLLKNGVNAKLLVVGEDWGFLSKCLALAAQLRCQSHVIFTGHISEAELSCAYEVARVVVIPSFFEGYGRVVLEGWLHNKPVIVTESVGLSEIVSPDRGLVVKTGDWQSLAAALHRLLKDQEMQSKMAHKGFELTKHHITLQKAIDKLEAIYEHVTYNPRVEAELRC